MNFERTFYITSKFCILKDIYEGSSFDESPVNFDKMDSGNFERRFTNENYIDGGFRRESVMESYR